LYGGEGLLDFYTEQGCSQTQVILAHLRFQKYLHNQIVSLLESFIIIAGITTPPLEAINLIMYVSSPWVLSLRTFLYQFNVTIKIPQLVLSNILSKHDQLIMIDCNLKQYTKSEQEMINCYRLLLQVNTLAKICNHQGNKILDCVADCTVGIDGTPTLFEYSISTLILPHQGWPPCKARRIWKPYLDKVNTTSNYLHST
jgi:hypothetical protein